MSRGGFVFDFLVYALTTRLLFESCLFSLFGGHSWTALCTQRGGPLPFLYACACFAPLFGRGSGPVRQQQIGFGTVAKMVFSPAKLLVVCTYFQLLLQAMMLVVVSYLFFPLFRQETRPSCWACAGTTGTGAPSPTCPPPSARPSSGCTSSGAW